MADSPYCDLNVLTALTLTALVLYVPANLLPILEVNLLGSIRTATIAHGAWITINQGFWLVGSAIFLAAVVAPLLMLLSILMQLILVSLEAGQRPLRWLLRWHPTLDQFTMLEVYLISFFVAAFKLGDFADLHFGIGTISFLLLFLISFYVQYEYNHQLMWERYDRAFKR